MTDDSDKSAAGPAIERTVKDKISAAGPEEGMASAMTRKRMIKRTYKDPPTNELMDVYAAWANDYDSDLIDGHGYMAPEDAVASFVTLGLASDAHILDAECGTGMVGLLLREVGDLWRRTANGPYVRLKSNSGE